MPLYKAVGLHNVNSLSSPPLGGSPSPPRVLWWRCFHWPLQPMLGTCWQRCQNRSMGSGFSKLMWSIKIQGIPLLIIQKKPVRSTNGKAKKIQHQLLQVGLTSLEIVYGNPVIVPEKTRKTGSLSAMHWLDADRTACRWMRWSAMTKTAVIFFLCRRYPWQPVKLWSRTKTTGSGTCGQPPRHHNVNNTHTQGPAQVDPCSTQGRCCREVPTPRAS